MPSFDIGMTFYNTGQRPGEVRSIRLTLTRLDGADQLDRHNEVFQAKWVVDRLVFENAHHRFEWMDKAVLRDWYPTLVLSAEPTVLHLVLEAGERWDEPVVGRFIVRLEVETSRRGQPIALGDYLLQLDEQDYEIEGRHTLARLEASGPVGGGWEYMHHHPPPGPAA